MAAEADRYAVGERRAVAVGSICAGVTEMLFRLRGFEDGYMDLAAEPRRARRLMERVLEHKLAYWGRVLPMLAGRLDVVAEADDLGGQARTLFSPATYRSLVKPIHRELFAFIHARTEARIFFHTCGAVRDLIPDLIEVGVDILNPVQVSAAGMDSAALKRDFGRDLAFWGGGVDTHACLAPAHPKTFERRHAVASRTWRPAAASCSRPSTTSSRTCRPRTCSRCTRARLPGPPALANAGQGLS